MLSSGLAHEFRNPANGVLNAIAPLRRLLAAERAGAGDPAATSELLDVIEGCAQQIAALSRELLGYSSATPAQGQTERLGKLVDEDE